MLLTNLLGNAIKFTPDESSVCLKAALLEEKDGICTIQFEVIDSGIGISPEQQTRLFQSFQQAEISTANKYGGTGLGLSISKNIVEMMNGKIWVESELDKGSTFTFTVQMKRGNSQKYENMTKGEDKSVSVNFAGNRILLAEDVDINCEILLTLLEPTLLEIDCVKNGADAVRLFKEAPERYDMILMDVQMPEMDGYEATRQIRALDFEKAKKIPIIAMTANVFREDIEKCLNAGMNDHIGKPINLENVLEKLQYYLLQHSEKQEISVT